MVLILLFTYHCYCFLSPDYGVIVPFTLIDFLHVYTCIAIPTNNMVLLIFHT